MVGKNAAGSSALALSFPATGTPSVLGTTTLNNELNSVLYTSCYMQSLFDGQMLSIQDPNSVVARGRAIYYTEHYNPAFKKTAALPAIARADGDVGSTVNIDLKSGDTATTTLSSDFYLTKEGMSYPLDVEDAAGAEFTTAIKSIQRGVYALSATSATTSIAAVNQDKCFVSSSSSSSSGADEDAYVQLSGSTTLIFVRNSNSGTTDISWEVIEFV